MNELPSPRRRARRCCATGSSRRAAAQQAARVVSLRDHDMPAYARPQKPITKCSATGTFRHDEPTTLGACGVPGGRHVWGEVRLVLGRASSARRALALAPGASGRRCWSRARARALLRRRDDPTRSATGTRRQNGANCSRGVGVAFDGVDDYVDLALARGVVDVGARDVWTAFWTPSAVAWWSMLCNFGDGANVDNIVVSRYQNGAQLRFGVAIGAAWERTSAADRQTRVDARAGRDRRRRTARCGCTRTARSRARDADEHAPRRSTHEPRLGRSDAGNYWAGAVGSVHAWSRALSASEVARCTRGRARCVTPPTPLPTSAAVARAVARRRPRRPSGRRPRRRARRRPRRRARRCSRVPHPAERRAQLRRRSRACATARRSRPRCSSRTTRPTFFLMNNNAPPRGRPASAAASTCASPRQPRQRRLSNIEARMAALLRARRSTCASRASPRRRRCNCARGCNALARRDRAVRRRRAHRPRRREAAVARRRRVPLRHGVRPSGVTAGDAAP